MIHVVEFASPQDVRAWFAFDEPDFLRKVQAAKARADWVIHDLASPRELFERAGAPENPTAADLPLWIAELAAEHGWDADLWRADHLFGQGVWRAQEVTPLDAHVAAVAEGLTACRVYLSDETAREALYNEAIYHGREAWRAHLALRDQLIALEVIADDL